MGKQQTADVYQGSVPHKTVPEIVQMHKAGLGIFAEVAVSRMLKWFGLECSLMVPVSVCICVTGLTAFV